jgi:hypothetical protein
MGLLVESFAAYILKSAAHLKRCLMQWELQMAFNRGTLEICTALGHCKCHIELHKI